MYKQSRAYKQGWMIVIIVAITFMLWGSLTMASEVVIGSRGDVATLDPHMRNEIWTMGVQDHIYEKLVTFGPDGELIPQLAERWSFVDEETWVFHLRQGVQFHNGENFTAAAVKFSINRIKIEPLAQFKTYTDPIVSVEALDEYSVQIKTDGPLAILPNYLCSVAMVPPAYFAEKSNAYLANHAIGTGPYKLVKWVKDDYLTLEVNKKYWGDSPAYERVTFRPIPIAATRIGALLSGEVDVIEALPVWDIDRVEKDPSVRVERCKSLRVIYLGIDLARKFGGEVPENSPGVAAGEPNPLADLRVRKAIYHAIDIEGIKKYVMKGSSYPCSQAVPPMVFGYNPEITRLPYDPELAKQLLAEAGYPNGFKVRLDCPNDRYINDEEIATVVVGYLSEVGIEVELNAVPKAVYFPQITNVDKTSFFLGGIAEPSMDCGGALYTCFHHKGLYSRPLYCNPEFETLIEKGIRTLDREERGKIYREAMAIIMADLPWIPLHVQESVYGTSEKVNWSPRFDEKIYAFTMSPKE